MAKKSAQFRLKSTERTDFRVRIMNEILSGIQVIKMYAWEKSFAKMVDQTRKYVLFHSVLLKLISHLK